MIDEDRGTAVPEEFAVGKLGSSGLLLAGLSASYLTRDGGSVRFYHQLLQEYFAAIGLKAAGLNTRLKEAFYSSLPGGVRMDPLEWRSRGTTKWDEVIVALCGIVEKPDEVVSAVLEADPSLASRCVASGVLLDPETRRKTVDRLVTMLRTRWPVSAAMAEALQRLGDPASAPGLVEILSAGPLETRAAAALALGGVGGPIAVAGLVEALGSESKAVRIRATRSLWRLGDPAAVTGLAGVLWDDERVYLYFSTSSSVQEEAVGALIRIGERAPGTVIPAMLEGLRSPEPKIRAASAEVLAAVGDRSAVRGLLDALVYDIDQRVTHASYTALGRLCDVRAVPELLDGLRHADRRARAASAEGLGSVGDRSAVRGLLDALAHDVAPGVRAASARALGAIGDSAAIPGLIDAFLRDPDFYVCDGAATALGRSRDGRIVPALLEGLRSPDDMRRLDAASALGAVGEGAAVPALLDALCHDVHVQVRDYARSALTQIGRLAVPELIGALDSPDPEVRRQAALALGSIGDPEALPALERKRNDEDDGTAQAAAEALSTLRRNAAARPDGAPAM